MRCARWGCALLFVPLLRPAQIWGTKRGGSDHGGCSPFGFQSYGGRVGVNWVIIYINLLETFSDRRLCVESTRLASPPTYLAFHQLQAEFHLTVTCPRCFWEVISVSPGEAAPVNSQTASGWCMGQAPSQTLAGLIPLPSSTSLPGQQRDGATVWATGAAIALCSHLLLFVYSLRNSVASVCLNFTWDPPEVSVGCHC